MSLFLYAMKRKLLVILFFIVVFGLPITWYFFLQVFGENKFDLPVLEQLDADCIALNDHTYLLLDSVKLSQNKNEAKRLSKHLSGIKQSEIQVVNGKSCLDEYEIIFVDSLGQLRGGYAISREEMDRLLTELDIYLLNLKTSKIENK
ncbi:MAG: hypothetical protein ACJA08_000702 [Cyclobacteriaceae bacterium]